MVKIYGTESKKMLNILILEILKNYSDANHRLSQQEIIRKLKSEYGVQKIDRRSIKANVQSLKNMGYAIEGVKWDDRGGEGYYLEERELDDTELRILIDSVLFSKGLSTAAAQKLVDKLKGFGNVYFDAKVSHVKTVSDSDPVNNKSVLDNVSVINDAMDKRKKISFRYNICGIDFKLHDSGEEYIVNPFQMVAVNGHYYLLGNNDKSEDISYYRIDRISETTVLNERIKSKKDIKGIEGRLDLPKFKAEHLQMLSGETVNASIKTTASMMDTLVDWFGKNFKITKIKGDEITISVKCNEKALMYWALQYGPDVEVLAPKKLRKEIAQAVLEMAKKYKK